MDLSAPAVFAVVVFADVVSIRFRKAATSSQWSLARVNWIVSDNRTRQKEPDVRFFRNFFDFATLTGASRNRLQFAQRNRGGNFSFSFRYSDIEKLRVLVKRPK